MRPVFVYVLCLLYTHFNVGIFDNVREVFVFIKNMLIGNNLARIMMLLCAWLGVWSISSLGGRG
jgi:hypothetical protein